MSSSGSVTRLLGVELIELDSAEAATPQHRIERLVQSFPDQGQTRDEQDDRQARKDRGPPDARGRVGDGSVDVVAPLGALRGLDPVAEKAERSKKQNRVRGIQG